MIAAYEEILATHRQEMLLQVQAQTIQEEPIREAMQAGFREVRRLVLHAFRQHAIADPEERTLIFLARGMLCNISHGTQFTGIDEGVKGLQGHYI